MKHSHVASPLSVWHTPERRATQREISLGKGDNMADVTIRALKNGPLEVTGGAKVTDQKRNEYQGQGDPVYLCRCGQSANKPFCDGTHQKVGFKAEETAG